jgi:antitoxin HigA-1
MNNYKIVSKDGLKLRSDASLHPGEILEMEITARKYKKLDFAQWLGIRPSQLSEILHGKRHINAQLAIKLEKILGINAEFWLRVQSSFDIFVEREKMETV